MRFKGTVNIGRIFHETNPLIHELCLSVCIALHCIALHCIFPGQFCEFNSELCCAKGKISDNHL